MITPYRISFLASFLFILGSVKLSAQDDNFNTLSDDLNWTSIEAYDINGNVKARAVSYFDELGKPIQSQSRDFKADSNTPDLIWTTQTLYDSEGRPVIGTLGAPIGNQFGYKNDFMLNASGNVYSTTDFEGGNVETPSKVSPAPNTLGWYYSEFNNLDPFQDITEYPFTRTIYDKLNPGNVLKTLGGNKVAKNGQEQWLNGFSYTVPATQELYYAFGRTYFEENGDEYLEGSWQDTSGLETWLNSGTAHVVTLKAYKTIVIDVHGTETVAFTDADGKTLAVARSGEGLQKEVISLIGKQGYVDIHLPKGCGGTLTYLGNETDYKVYNLREGTEVTNSSNLPSGVYRIEALDDRYLISPPLSTISVTGSLSLTSSNNMGVRYKVNYYDYSLNYYDKLGTLKESLQPLGFDNTYTLTQNTPNHNTAYKSTVTTNSLGQLLSASDPDGGTSNFKYRKDGQIRYSQNKKQQYNQEFSYTEYDDLGRPIESGYMSNPNFNTIDPDGPPVAPGVYRGERHAIVYDLPDTVGLHAALIAEGIGATSYYPSQTFLSGAVSKTYTENPSTTITWYSYDIYGRAKWVVQRIDGLGTKTIDYVYDPITGNVLEVDFQRHKPDERFVHRYTYNSVDELTLVETSTNGTDFTPHGEYIYNESGALRRMNIGGSDDTNDVLQGVDYVYNLGGQLKAINSPQLNAASDPGNDTNDLFGMTIDYHTNDYQRNNTLPSVSGGIDRFDGNIKAIQWNTNGIANTNTDAYYYQYDDRGWLENASFNQNISEGTTGLNTIEIRNNTVPDKETVLATQEVQLNDGFVADANTLADFTAYITNGNPTLIDEDGDYNVVGLTYDQNGNLQSLKRNKNTENGSNAMDDFTYNYKPNTNQLDYVSDAVTETTNALDLKSQTANNYVYNQIGQLVTNNEENVTYKYNTAGLVTEVTKDDFIRVKFAYNDKGHRIKKESYDGMGTLTQTTYYVRDVAGTALAVYANGTLTEHSIYGASMLGVHYRQGNDGTDVYQLTDHLGNVRAVVGRDTNGDAETNGATDYYPFGMTMPNRHLADANGYRYAYQGQEKDPETGKEAFQLRLWDSRIGRWLTTDPAGQYNSPYLGMGNNPVSRVDPDGGMDCEGCPPEAVVTATRIGQAWGGAYSLEPVQSSVNLSQRLTGLGFFWKPLTKNVLIDYLTPSFPNLSRDALYSNAGDIFEDAFREFANTNSIFDDFETHPDHKNKRKPDGYSTVTKYKYVNGVRKVFKFPKFNYIEVKTKNVTPDAQIKTFINELALLGSSHSNKPVSITFVTLADNYVTKGVYREAKAKLGTNGISSKVIHIIAYYKMVDNHMKVSFALKNTPRERHFFTNDVRLD